MICWYSYWGLPKPVADLYREYEAKLGETLLYYGPGHIVWADYNFKDEHIRWCLDALDRDEYWPYDEVAETDKRLVRESLERLLAVPEAIRCPEPDDYDEWNPENYPPPAGLELVKPWEVPP